MLYYYIDSSVNFSIDLSNLTDFKKFLISYENKGLDNLKKSESFKNFLIKLFFSYTNFIQSIGMNFQYDTDMNLENKFFNLDQDGNLFLDQKYSLDYLYSFIWNSVIKDFYIIFDIFFKNFKLKFNYPLLKEFNLSYVDLLTLSIFSKNFDFEKILIKQKDKFYKNKEKKKIKSDLKIESNINLQKQKNNNVKTNNLIIKGVTFFKQTISNLYANNKLKSINKNLKINDKIDKINKKKLIIKQNKLKIIQSIRYSSFDIFIQNWLNELKYKFVKVLFDIYNDSVSIFIINKGKDQYIKKHNTELLTKNFLYKHNNFNNLNEYSFFKKKSGLIFYKNNFRFNLDLFKNLNLTFSKYKDNFIFFKDNITDNEIKLNIYYSYYYSISYLLILRNNKNIYQSFLKNESKVFLNNRLNISYKYNNDLNDFSIKLKKLESIFSKNFEKKFFIDYIHLEDQIFSQLESTKLIMLKSNIYFQEFDILYEFLYKIKNDDNKLPNLKLKLFLILIKKFHDELYTSFFNDVVNYKDMINIIINFSLNSPEEVKNLNKYKLYLIFNLYTTTSKIFSKYLVNDYFNNFNNNKNNHGIIYRFPFYLDFRGRSYNHENIFSPTGSKCLRYFFNFNDVNYKNLIDTLKKYDKNKFIMFKYKFNVDKIYLEIINIFKFKNNKIKLNSNKIDNNFIFLNSMIWILIELYKYLEGKINFSYINLDTKLIDFLKKNKNTFLDFYKLYFININKINDSHEFFSIYEKYGSIYDLDEDEFFNFFNNFIQLIKMFIQNDYIPDNYIYKDASANVFQHILLISGSKDKEIFKKFNLHDDIQYNDPYTFIKDNLYIEEEIKNEFKNLFSDFYNANNNCINFMFSRKFLKSIFMTYCYRATPQNWSTYIYSDDNFINLSNDMFVFYKVELKSSNEISWVFTNIRIFVNNFIKILTKSLQTFFKINFNINLFDYFSIKQNKEKKNKNENYYLNLNDLNVNLSYFKTVKKQSKDSLLVKSKNIEKITFNCYDDFDSRKTNTALLANTVHSCDSRVLRLVQSNLPYLTTNHDSFGSLPCLQDAVIQEYRSSFYKFYDIEFPDKFNDISKLLNITEYYIFEKPDYLDSDYCLI